MDARNDGNKIYKIKSASKSLNGPDFKNYASFISSHYQGLENEMYVKVDIQIDE